MKLQMYPTLNRFWLAMVNAALQRGDELHSRDGDCSEILDVGFTLADPKQCFVFNQTRKASIAYAAAELLWYFLGTQSIEMIKAYAPQYERFANDGKAHGAYGHRWSQDPVFAETSMMMTGKVAAFALRSQLTAVTELLRKKSGTRQAVVTMWNAGDLLWAIEGSRNDIPCTLSIQFHLRENKLYTSVTMRSQDIWLGLPYDVFCFSSIQQMLAAELGCELGTYSHHVGSMHLYHRDRDKALQCWKQQCDYDNLEAVLDPFKKPEGELALGEILRMEQEMRNGEFARRTMRSILYEAHTVAGKGNLFVDLILAVCTKWRPDLYDQLRSNMAGILGAHTE